MVVVVYAKKKPQHARSRALFAPCSPCKEMHHGSVILNPQQRVRVTAERLVARTRSESSSSALKVPKSSWLAHHCRCGKTTTALLQTRPRQEREREFRIPLHSSLALQLVAAPLATSLISIRVSKSLYMIRSSNTSMHRANYQVLDLHTCSGESSDVRLTI